MKTEKIRIAGMTCASCEKLVTSAVEAAGGKVHAINAQAGEASIECPEGSRERMNMAIASAGYEVLGENGKPAAPEPFEAQLIVFVQKLLSGSRELAVERALLKMSLLSFAGILFMGAFLYMFALRGLPGIGAFIPYLAYAVLSSVALTAAIAHYRSHRFSFTCMEGMMVGMTIGMAGGFLFGAIVGATNGMFVGTVFGMAVGMLSGAYCGRCCGIMGAMEGLMAGLMSGTMGAMLTVMMQYDNLAIFMPIFVASCLVMLAGFTYMIYSSAGKRGEGKLMNIGDFFTVSAMLALATAAVILFAPRSGVVFGGGI